jgi:hypothetical protein
LPSPRPHRRRIRPRHELRPPASIRSSSRQWKKKMIYSRRLPDQFQEPKRGNAYEGLKRAFNRGPHGDDSTTVAATVYPAVPSAPRPATRRRREEGLLASGSQLAFSFPRPHASVGQCTLARRLQLRGQPRNYTAFRFNALHTLRVRGSYRISGARGRVAVGPVIGLHHVFQVEAMRPVDLLEHRTRVEGGYVS